MAHLTHVFGENCEAIYIDGRLLLSGEVIPVGNALYLFHEKRLVISTLEFHGEVSVDSPDKFPDDVASLVTMKKGL